MSITTKLITAAVAVVAVACGSREVVVGEDYQRVLDPLRAPTRKLDVLFVIDTSASMLPEQTAMIDAAGAQLFGQLERDLGGKPDLHVAVVTTDVALGILGVPGCPAGTVA